MSPNSEYELTGKHPPKEIPRVLQVVLRGTKRRNAAAHWGSANGEKRGRRAPTLATHDPLRVVVFFGRVTWLAGCQVPNQGLNLGPWP